MQSEWLLEKVTACFDRLSMNGVVLFVSQNPSDRHFDAMESGLNK